MANVDLPQQPAPGEPDPAEAQTASTVEAVLFSADKPLSPARLAEIAGMEGVRAVRKAVDALNERYEQAGTAFRVIEIAGGYQMQSLPQYGEVLARLHKSRSDSRLSQAALETLAIVAYRQPALRADIEAIRGVSCGEVLRGLMEKNLVRIVGRAEEIGRPLLYGTTRLFLEVFGLRGLNDLPNVQQLRQAAQTPPAEKPGSSPPEESPPEAAQADAAPAVGNDEPETQADGPPPSEPPVQ